MRSSLRLLLITGSLVALCLGAAVSATAATTSAPTLVTSNYACGSGTCEVGPGNVGLAFGSELTATGATPVVSGCEYAMSVTSGSLPPGLQLGGPTFGEFCSNIISGTPTSAGTYSFTVQITPQTGPSGTQKLTITIGTGSSDRLSSTTFAASYIIGTIHSLSVSGYDANAGALYSLSVTATGKQLIAPESMVGHDGIVSLGAVHTAYPCPTNAGCNLTVSDSLGSSVTVFLGPAKYDL